MNKNTAMMLAGAAAVAVYLATRGAAPWWSGLALSGEQRAMLESQERDFWATAQGNTGYPVPAMTNTGAPAVWL